MLSLYLFLASTSVMSIGGKLESMTKKDISMFDRMSILKRKKRIISSLFTNDILLLIYHYRIMLMTMFIQHMMKHLAMNLFHQKIPIVIQVYFSINIL
jgi:hypothetical protein